MWLGNTEEPISGVKVYQTSTQLQFEFALDKSFTPDNYKSIGVSFRDFEQGTSTAPTDILVSAVSGWYGETEGEVSMTPVLTVNLSKDTRLSPGKRPIFYAYAQAENGNYYHVGASPVRVVIGGSPLSIEETQDEGYFRVVFDFNGTSIPTEHSDIAEFGLCTGPFLNGTFTEPYFKYCSFDYTNEVLTGVSVVWDSSNIEGGVYTAYGYAKDYYGRYWCFPEDGTSTVSFAVGVTGEPAEITMALLGWEPAASQNSEDMRLRYRIGVKGIRGDETDGTQWSLIKISYSNINMGSYTTNIRNASGESYHEYIGNLFPDASQLWGDPVSVTVTLCCGPRGYEDVIDTVSMSVTDHDVSVWDWNSSNGLASADECRKAYTALTQRGATTDCSYLVWNALVSMVFAVYYRSLYTSWDYDSYASAQNTLMNASDKEMTARRFNSLNHNINNLIDASSKTIDYVEISEKQPGDRVYGQYFLDLANNYNNLYA